jgi:hypothetical protein
MGTPDSTTPITRYALQSTDESTAASNSEGLCLLTATPENNLFSMK